MGGKLWIDQFTRERNALWCFCNAGSFKFSSELSSFLGNRRTLRREGERREGRRGKEKRWKRDGGRKGGKEREKKSDDNI